MFVCTPLVFWQLPAPSMHLRLPIIDGKVQVLLPRCLNAINIDVESAAAQVKQTWRCVKVPGTTSPVHRVSIYSKLQITTIQENPLHYWWRSRRSSHLREIKDQIYNVCFQCQEMHSNDHMIPLLWIVINRWPRHFNPQCFFPFLCPASPRSCAQRFSASMQLYRISISTSCSW